MPPEPTAPAATTDYGTAFNELGNVYDPQVASVNTQLAAIPGQQQAAQSQLDQAKTNAFRDIGITANNRGILNSGYSPYEQNDYTTTKYNPAVTDLNNTTAANKQTLQDKITSINNQRAQDAESLVTSTQAAQAKLQAAQIKAQNAAATTANNASQTAADKAASANYVQGKAGNYMFVNNSGKSINLQQYVNNTGGDINTVLGLLQNGTTYDKAIYNKVLAAKPSNPTAALNLIRQLDTQKAYGF